MLDFSNESTKTSHSSVFSSLTFGLWVSSHLSNQSAKVGTAECAERSAAPRCGVLDHPQGSVSSTSCLPLQAFPSLQIFASVSVINFLHRFWLFWRIFFPSYILPTACAFRRAHQLRLFFPVFLCFFAFYFFAVFSTCFFIHFWCFWARLETPKSSQIW